MQHCIRMFFAAYHAAVRFPLRQGCNSSPPINNSSTLSAARPGSRSETIENYIQRLEKLEEMAKSFDGVDRVYAIQAGREIRIVVKPDKVDDLASHKIARDIKTKIEEELTYPGHIKVTVIREIRASEIAK